MMSNNVAGDSEHETAPSSRFGDKELSPEDAHQVEIGALAFLRAQEIKDQRDAETQRAAEELRRDQVGVYNKRRSTLMLVVNYMKLLCFIVFSVAIYFGLRYFLAHGYVADPRILSGYLLQMNISVFVFAALVVWLGFRIFRLWSDDVLYADINRIRRTRKPSWYLGIRKISFQVDTGSAHCNLEPTNFEVAIKNLGFDASSIDIDTAIQKDKPIHDLKYVKDAETLEAIINF